MENKNVLVAMSGGVDSSATALLLKQNGYDVSGCILKMHEYNQKAIDDATKVSENIGVELIVVDVRTEFEKIVQEDFYNEYLNGRTPNPCVLCNRKVKFKTLFDIADDKNIALIATGHYAKKVVDAETGRYSIIKANDTTKDQTYMLWRLPQEYLSRIIFPIGEYYSKSEVRLFAKENNIPVFDKGDSQDICFIPAGDYRSFIDAYSKNRGDVGLIKEGDIIIDGKVIGKHKGTPYYTVGQRRGLGVAYKTPIYVKRIDLLSNVIEVAVLENTYSKGLAASDFNILKYDNYLPEKEYNIKIRYKDAGKIGIAKIENEKLIVNFIELRSSVALGQSVVLYENDVLIGGGIIDCVF